MRVSGDAAHLLPAAEREIWRLGTEQNVYQLETFEARLADDLAVSRFLSQMLAGFALVALSLGAIGVYAALRMAVARRTREIGIRVALGADRRDVLRAVVGEGMRLGVAGVGVGLTAAFLLSGALSSRLYGVGRADPLIFLLVPAVLLGVVLAACLLPALRASGLDPILALEAD